MKFHFIDNTTPLDRHSQKAIRSHAMKGKNLGKTIPARGHRGRQSGNEIRSAQARPKVEEGLPKVENDRLLLPKASKPDSGNALTSPKQMVSLQNHFPGAELAYFSIPEPLIVSSRYLLHEFHFAVTQTLYPSVFCHESKETATTWFDLMVANPCVLHCGLAMTGAHISRQLGRPNVPPEATRHFVEAMRLLRRELSTNPEPQDSSVAVIISLAIHATLTGAVDESRIHLHGLNHIVKLRPGGLAALCKALPEVGNKVRRADLHLALMAGTPTIFGSQSSPLPATPHVVPLDRKRLNATLPHPLGKTSPVLRAATRDVLALCSYAGCSQLRPFQYQDLVISIFQRLVDYSPLVGPRPPRLLDDVCQLGFLAFMSTVVHYDGQKTTACSALLSEALWTGIGRFNNDMVSSQERRNSSFSLWLIFVYAVSAPGYEQYCNASSSVARHIHALADTLTLRTWEDVIANLSVYPWISAFHDKLGKKLWESVICI